MNAVVKTWYETNSQEIKLLQFLLYHLKRNGHCIQTKKGIRVAEPVVKETVKIQYGEFFVVFE